MCYFILVHGEDVNLSSQNVGCQTNEIDILDNSIQTDETVVSNNSMQTIICSFNETAVQTDIREQLVASIQTEQLPVKDNGVQAVCNFSTIDAQTSSSLSKEVEGSSQTVIDVSDCSFQTEVATENCGIQVQALVQQSDTQTDFQAVTSQLTQTDWKCADNDSQTMLSMLLENECASQTDIASEEIGIQTTAVIISHADSQTLWLSADNSMQTELVIVDCANQTELIEYNDNNEKSSQTDPVTIIIGDASFLMQKLKGPSIALSPTKMHLDTNNEIEFEIQDGDSITSSSVPSEMGNVYAGESENAYQTSYTNSPTVHDVSITERSVSRRGQSSKISSNSILHSSSTRTSSGPIKNPMKSFNKNANVSRVQQSVSVGKYSCPVCPQTFAESPELYEHLQSDHLDACAKVKKPKGREGKTIFQRSPQSTTDKNITRVATRSNERGQLVPVKEVNASVHIGIEPGLFEDNGDQYDEDDLSPEHENVRGKRVSLPISNISKRRKLEESPAANFVGRKSSGRK